MGKRNATLLTKKKVDESESAEKRYHVWDNDLAGFGLRVEPTGVKTFIAKYRANGGGRSATQRVVTIGRFGALTADQAPKQAKVILGGAAAGSDPAAEIQAKRREMKISVLILLRHERGDELVACRSAWQQGHRSRLLARATVSLRRMVAMELGTCRSGLIAVYPGETGCLRR